jgi:hypothetical protein
MRIIDNMGYFIFSCVCDLVECHGIALILLEARMKCYGCGGMRAVIFPV